MLSGREKESEGIRRNEKTVNKSGRNEQRRQGEKERLENRRGMSERS